MAVYKVQIGSNPDSPEFTFEPEDFRSRPQRVSDLDPIASRLSVDELSVRVHHVDDQTFSFIPRRSSGMLTANGERFLVHRTSILSIPYGTPVRLVEGEDLVCELYFVESSQADNDIFELLAASPIGFLDRQTHLGGVYTRATAGQLFGELIGDAFGFSVAPDLSAEPVRGWLPIDTARNNLHRVLFALGASIMRSPSGEILIGYLPNEDPTEIPDARVFLGGKIDYAKPATAVEITQHSFYQLPDTQMDELFSNLSAAPANRQMVTFREPYWELQATGSLILHESGANYAIVSGSGTLLGRKYTHTTQVIQRGAVETTDARSLVTVSNIGLISALNSSNIADRLYAYYSARREISATLKLENERTGDRVAFTGPDGPVTGILTRLETAYSTFPKALAKLVTGYAPTAPGNTYNALASLDQGETWTASSAGKIMVAVIGGGDGGYGGASGQTALGNDDGVSGGVGGPGGSAGLPGKIRIEEFAVEAGDSVSAVQIGEGGVGGAGGISSEDEGSGPVVGAPGGAGGETIALIQRAAGDSTISSALGQRVTGGYLDPISGDLLALPGSDGVSGGAGNGPDGNGEIIGQWIPGANPESMSMDYYWPANRSIHIRVQSGYGSGAAHGSDGSDGERWASDPPVVVPTQDTYDTATMPAPIAGPGADGADAANYPAPANGIGAGGSGGHGGGGGGCGGAYWINNIKSASSAGGHGGRGGSGSNGQTGGRGALLIYYRGA